MKKKTGKNRLQRISNILLGLSLLVGISMIGIQYFMQNMFYAHQVLFSEIETISFIACLIMLVPAMFFLIIDIFKKDKPDNAVEPDEEVKTNEKVNEEPTTEKKQVEFEAFMIGNGTFVLQTQKKAKFESKHEQY